MAREQWGSRTGFILAAVGSAIGLGNIWRFPYVAYDNGGGAFFVPYLFALLTAGIPLLVLEYSIGHRYRGSAPLALRRISPRIEWLGWWQGAIAFVIASYYAVIIAWAVAYTWYSFTLAWGDDPDTFLFQTYLRAADVGEIGGLVPAVAIPLVLVWLVALGILIRGVRKGIEVATKVMIPTLVVVFAVLVIRALTLPGAAEGLDALFRPDFGALGDAQVWVAAYGQIFFSLSIAFAIMVTYASYLPPRSDLTNNAFIAGFANSSFEVLAGIGVFAALGVIAQATGVAIDEVATQGIGLAFVAFPQIINELPGLNALFGVIFFGCLVLAGLTSLISITEVSIAALVDKYGWRRNTAIAIGGGACALVSLLFTTAGGINFLDVADSFINNFGVALAGLVEVVLIAWVVRKLDDLQAHANEISDIRLGVWWKACLLVITPLVLGYQAVENVRVTLTEGYGDYPLGFLVVAGWSVAVAALVAGFILWLPRWNATALAASDADLEEASR